MKEAILTVPYNYFGRSFNLFYNGWLGWSEKYPSRF